MTAKHTVLIPLDGSAFSRCILAQVASLLSPAETRLTLLHVANYPTGITGLPGRPVNPELLSTTYYDSGQDLAQSQHPIYASQASTNVVAAVQAELQGEARHLTQSGYEVTIEVRFGDPAKEIVILAQKGHFNMVAMTTHGRSGLSRLLFGSVAEEVLRNLTIPVLLLRPFAQGDTDARR